MPTVGSVSGKGIVVVGGCCHKEKQNNSHLNHFGFTFWQEANLFVAHRILLYNLAMENGTPDHFSTTSNTSGLEQDKVRLRGWGKYQILIQYNENGSEWSRLFGVRFIEVHLIEYFRQLQVKLKWQCGWARHDQMSR